MQIGPGSGKIKALLTMSNQNNTPSRPASPQPGFLRELQTEFLVHELKDPLAIIETGVRMLLERQDRFGSLSAQQHKTLQRVLRNTEKARSMTYDLLEIGRSESGCFACCHFDPVKVCWNVLRETLELFPAKTGTEVGANITDNDFAAVLAVRGIVFTARLPDPQIEMMQDETKFRQIIGNLIKNALAHYRKKIEILVANEGETLVMEVTDDGPGIDPAHHERVFQRYAQVGARTCLPRSGHGIGLAGAQILARSLGGEVSIRSRKGTGATFRLSLPFTLDAA